MNPPTAEQAYALELFDSGQSLAIEAGAGTGKTTTLQLLANATRKRGQYLAFNRAIVQEAKEKMPGNVYASTAHALAMRSVGYRYRHRLDSDRMRSTEIAGRLGLDPLVVTTQFGERKRLAASYLAGLTIRTVTQFCQRADTEPTDDHVPYVEGIDLPRGEMANNRLVRLHIRDAVRRAWADFASEEGQLPFRHDHYLKLYQLSGARIPADFVLFDEAQDASPVMVAIVAAQTHAQLVWVGDSQQQIYSFTGAVNALAAVPADARAFLSRSFRFGPEIAEVANIALAGLDAELRLVGSDSIRSHVQPIPDPDCILTRTNAEAVQTVLTYQRKGLRPHLVGGGKEVVAFARAAQRLMRGEFADHPDLACFDSWGEVREYVGTDAQGGDLRLLVDLVDEFGVARIIDALERMPREENAQPIVSTAHKAKGREWFAVKLAGDFPAEATGEELRLLYVAATRAQHLLDVEAAGYFTERLREPITHAGVNRGREAVVHHLKSRADVRPGNLVVLSFACHQGDHFDCLHHQPGEPHECECACHL